MVSPDSHHQTLVLGIGNLLWADEGFGVRCVEHLRQHFELDPAVLALDGGTQGLYLLPYLQQAQRLIVFDAIDYGLPPGTLKLVADDAVPRFMGAKKMSLHQTGFQEVIAAAELTGHCPAQMLLIGVQPLQLEDFGGSLTAPVRARVPVAAHLAARRLRRWGLVARRRSTRQPEATGARAALALDAYEDGRPSAAQACRHGDPRVLAQTGAEH